MVQDITLSAGLIQLALSVLRLALRLSVGSPMASGEVIVEQNEHLLALWKT